MLLLSSHIIQNTLLKIQILKSSFGHTFIANCNSNSLLPLAANLSEKSFLHLLLNFSLHILLNTLQPDFTPHYSTKTCLKFSDHLSSDFIYQQYLTQSITPSSLIHFLHLTSKIPHFRDLTSGYSFIPFQSPLLVFFPFPQLFSIEIS